MRMLILISVMLLTSCATIIHGPVQKIPVNSYPENADIIMNNKIIGKTPDILVLKRYNEGEKQSIVKIEKLGYLPSVIILMRQIDPITFGNILIGGIPGFFIDAVTGSLFMLSPNSINVNLIPGELIKK